MDLVERVKRALLGMSRYSWEQGVAAQAMLELKQMDWVVLMAKDAAVRQLPDGRLAMMGDTQAATDPAANGVPLMAAWKVTGDPALLQAKNRLLAWLLRSAPRSDSGILYHVTDHRQIWVDSFYMAPPFLAAAGYPGEAVKQIEGFWQALYHPGARLLSHIWDDDWQCYKREAFWGVGNGWAAAGMTRVLADLPDTMEAEKEALRAHIRDILAGCLAHRRRTGCFTTWWTTPPPSWRLISPRCLPIPYSAAWRRAGWRKTASPPPSRCAWPPMPGWMPTAWSRESAARPISTAPARRWRGRRFSC